MTNKQAVSWHHSAIAAICLTLPFASGVGAAPLPGGAGSLVETYQDWVVACGAQNNATTCVMRQVQTTQAGEHMLTAELLVGADGQLGGALLMPFGLALALGVALNIDETEGPVLSFSTCLPRGCIAPVSFEAAVVDKLEAGGVLNLTATAAGPQQPVPFKVSLKGFSAALARMMELTK
ncbi:invasion associated locus B family protein [Devosia sp.]|uniref:invasion associated locus B family protein n=1 Tax=Devosia sp. TaxID=1871048 RepID=UPI002FC9FC09